VGLAALLSGSREYSAFDVVEYAQSDRNLTVFDELVELFRSRAGTPDRDGFPDIGPLVDLRGFPSHILTDERLAASLAPSRVAAIRAALLNPGTTASDGISLRYIVPWQDAHNLRPGSIDFLFSHAVLEHIDDLPSAYASMYEWLKPGGMMSHQIDFRSHGLTTSWNGHWAYSNFVWAIIRGKRPFLLNRQPYSVHRAFMRRTGFRIVGEYLGVDETGLRRGQLAPRWRTMSDADLTCSGVLVQAVR
jgi:hypothetical protein